MRGKRIRGHILGSVVDARSGSSLRMIRPVRCEDFKCFSAQKEIKGFAPFLIQDLAHNFIRIGSQPAAVGKSAAGVLLRSAGSLDNAIECDKGLDNEFSHSSSFLLLFFDAGILTLHLTSHNLRYSKGTKNKALLDIYKVSNLSDNWADRRVPRKAEVAFQEAEVGYPHNAA